jgi:hypothetical protein
MFGCCPSKKPGKAQSVGEERNAYQELISTSLDINSQVHMTILLSLYYRLTGMQKGLWIYMGLKSNNPEKEIHNLLELMHLLYLCEQHKELIGGNLQLLVEMSFMCTSIVSNCMHKKEVMKYSNSIGTWLKCSISSRHQ